MSAPDVRAALESAANQILALVAPATARLVRASVVFDEDDDTAKTDGIRIWLPPAFAGHDLYAGGAGAADPTLAVGLLVHELGHFLQDLKALQAAEQAAGAPHWLGNIIADIQLEAMMAYLFPPLAGALVAVRQAVRDAQFAAYARSIQQAAAFADAACALALAGRFGVPAVAYDAGQAAGVAGVLNQSCDPRRRAYCSRAAQFTAALAAALHLTPAELPDFVREIMRQFPELRQAPETHTAPQGGQTQVGVAGQAVQAEAHGNGADYAAHQPAPVQRAAFLRGRPQPDAVRAVPTLRLHFRGAPAATELVAPGRLDRRAAATGEIVPLRMAVPGKEAPKPRLVIALDTSGSMKGAKFMLAQAAAQALTLAVQDVGGQVIGLTFSGAACAASSRGPQAAYDDTPLFAPEGSHSWGGTSFLFLTDAWRQWPKHDVFLITDGAGDVPPALPADRARTRALLIPPDCDAQAMNQIACRVVQLTDLSGLASVMTLLLPRR